MPVEAGTANCRYALDRRNDSTCTAQPDGPGVLTTSIDNSD
jgi:hypothetical protein